MNNIRRLIRGSTAPAAAPSSAIYIIAACAITCCLGCSPAAQVTPALEGTAPRPLPFRGRLISKSRQHVPPVIAQSLDESSTIAFQYDETVIDEHNAVPVLVSLLNPLVLFGFPLGSYTTVATGDLRISDGETVLGRYSAQARVSGSYGLYYGPTFPELERQGRSAVEQSIDESLYRDVDRLKSQRGASADPQIKRVDR
jgi:hypothetical protein